MDDIIRDTLNAKVKELQGDIDYYIKQAEQAQRNAEVFWREVDAKCSQRNAIQEALEKRA